MKWYLYDNLDGKTILKTNDEIPRCPICVNVMKCIGYEGTCCGLDYRIDGKWLVIKEFFAEHDKKIGRGWQSLREVPIQEIRFWWNWKNHVFSKYEIGGLIRNIDEDVQDIFARDNDFGALETNFLGQDVVTNISAIIWSRFEELFK